MLADASEELSKFIFTSKYARWLPELKRRETWDEAVDRVLDMHLRKFKDLPAADKEEIRWAFDLVRQKRVLPSMRSLQFGGPAIEANNCRLFNCCCRFVDSIRSFAELGFLMLCGTGTGIGLQKQFMDRLPNLVSASDKTGTVINYTIEDTIEGWADALEALLSCYFKNTAFSGRKIVFDYSKIRRKGTPLKTSGGKAPGYKPLKTTLAKIKDHLDYVIEELGQSRLRSIDIYDILMLFADCVVSGGIRRTASIVIFAPDDTDMVNAKTDSIVTKYRATLDEDTNVMHCRVWLGKRYYDVSFDMVKDAWAYDKLVATKRLSWMFLFPHRARSNNSVMLLRDELKLEDFEAIFERTKMYGEPGFCFSSTPTMLMNPCAEVSFVPVTEDGICGVQFCNLVTLSGSRVKTVDDFREAVKAQTIIGTLQASYTDLPYLSNTARQLTEEEALLGNSITGYMSNPEILLNADILQEMALYSVDVNREWAAKIGINPAARINLTKPEGTGSKVVGDAEGAHAWHAKDFFLRVQCNTEDNVYQMFQAANPHMCETSVWNNHGTDDVITFPISAPEGAKVKDDYTAIQHLEVIKLIQQNWILPSEVNNKKPVSHNVSCTVIVRDEEWAEVIQYLYDNREYFCAVSFIPYIGDKIYPQAPREKVVTEEDREKFEMLKTYLQSVDYARMVESSDGTYHVAEAACAGGACLI